MKAQEEREADFGAAVADILSGSFLVARDESVPLTEEITAQINEQYNEKQAKLKALVNEALEVQQLVDAGKLSAKQVDEAWYIAWMIGDDENDAANEQAEMARWFKILIEFATRD